MITLSVFNNKGGVGKTTYMFHIGHILSRREKNVLFIDLDTQGNLTQYCLGDEKIQKSWGANGNSIFRIVEPIIRGTGDVKFPLPTKVDNAKENLFIVPGDLRLSDYEDLLGDTWNPARGGAEAALRAQTAIHRYIIDAAEKTRADIVLIDLGPNLGALNRASLASSDYFMTPVAPDLFSIQGTENLGNKLVAWAGQWDQVKTNSPQNGIAIPHGKPKFLGYVMQMHNVRKRSADGMTEGWSIYGRMLEEAISTNIADKIGTERVEKSKQAALNLGKIPNLHSLIPYSQHARKPIFDCTGKDGLKGAHQTRAKDSIKLFDDIIKTIENML